MAKGPPTFLLRSKWGDLALGSGWRPRGLLLIELGCNRQRRQDHHKRAVLGRTEHLSTCPICRKAAVLSSSLSAAVQSWGTHTL